jgi:hypothetical protein
MASDMASPTGYDALQGDELLLVSVVIGNLAFEGGDLALQGVDLRSRSCPRDLDGLPLGLQAAVQQVLAVIIHDDDSMR